MDSSTRTRPGVRLTVRGLFLAMGAILLLGACASGAEDADPIGTWGVDGPGLPQLVLEAGGGLHGTDGCNVLGGEWRLQGGFITTDGVISTRMYCDGVDDWLSGLSTARVEGDTLHVFDSSGAEIGTLPRA